MDFRGTDGAWILGKTEQHLTGQTEMRQRTSELDDMDSGSWPMATIKRTASGSSLNNKRISLPYKFPCDEIVIFVCNCYHCRAQAFGQNDVLLPCMYSTSICLSSIYQCFICIE